MSASDPPQIPPSLKPQSSQPKPKPKPKPKPAKKWNLNMLLTNFKEAKKFFKISYWKNNLSYLITFAMFSLFHIALIIYVLIIRANSNVPTKFARVPGMLLNLDSALIILLVLKRLITWFRNTQFGRKAAVLDEVLEFHKMMGFLLGFLAIIHSFGHFFNLWYLSSDYSPTILNETSNETVYMPNTFGTYGELLFTRKSGLGWVYGTACPTGWALLVCLSIMIIFSLPCIRRKGHFQTFYYTHWCYVAYFLLLIIHAPNFIYWFIGPLILTLFERIYTKIRINSVKYGEFYIRDVNLLPSRVTNLVIARPADFKYKAGDYIFINLPRIAKFEWHPFTVSSCPEQEDVLTVHIRSLGFWTNKIYDYFDKLELNVNQFEINSIKYEDKFKVESESDDTSLKETSSLNSAKSLLNVDVKVFIDGPFGTSSRRIFDSEHAVLISAGIGVTPFASILQSLWYKYAQSKKKCGKCSHEWFEKLSLRKFKKVDFIWTNRDFGSFEWFVQLLGELELRQSIALPEERFIDIHLFMTSAKTVQYIKKNDKKPEIVAPAAAEAANNEDVQDKDDSFSLKLNPGRPNLDSLFQKISNENKGKVKVFFCGPPELGKLVELKSTKFEFEFSKEYF